jgi:biopolymer transport protein TolR
MGMQTGGSGRAMSEINVTPMVDVMLVLLIIFMVTAPLIQQGVAVELPQTKAQTLDVQENRLVLSLTRERRILLGDTEIPYPELREKIVGNIKLRQDKQIYLHADRNLPYGFVVDVMAIMKDAGVESLGMVTDPMQEGTRP